MDEPEPIVAEDVETEEVEGEEAKVEACAEEEVGEEDETDAEIEAMKKRVKEMEEEAAKIEALQTTVEKSMKASGAPPTGPAVDARSIYVGNVDYATTNDDLKEFFKACGTVNRVTIGMNKFTGQPKGCVFVRAAFLSPLLSSSFWLRYIKG